MDNKLICRACLKPKFANHCKSMSTDENGQSFSIFEMLNCCIPELDIELVMNPVICKNCIKELKIAFKFKTECLKNEEKLLKYSHSTNSKINLNTFYKHVHLSTHNENIFDNREPPNIPVAKVDQDVKQSHNQNVDVNVTAIENIFEEPRFNCKNCYGCQNKLLDSCYHSKNNISPFICYNCDKEIKTIIDLRKHMLNHQRRRRCKVCNKCFRDLHHLSTHLKTHTGSRPFSCTLCPKSFRDKDKFDQHLKQHRGDKMLKCKICKRVLSTTYNLKVHMKRHTKRNKCELCGEAFNTKVELVKHLEIDTETCGSVVKPKVKIEVTSQPLQQDLIKIEPEYFFENDNFQVLCKEECEDTEVDEIDVMN